MKTHYFREMIGSREVALKKKPKNIKIKMEKKWKVMLKLFLLSLVFQPLAKYVYLAQAHCFVGV